MEILQLKNTIGEIKTSVDVFNRRMERTEEIISELEGRTNINFSVCTTERKETGKNGQSLRHL